MSELTFEQMLEESFKTIRNGEVVDGTVIDVKPDEIILNIGYKADGIITRNEYTNEANVDLTTVVSVGDTMQAKVLKVNDGEGQVLLTYRRLVADNGNKKLEEAFEKEFRKKRVICKNIYAYEKQDGQIEIIMNARTVKGRLVTATELSKIMSNIMQKRLKPSDASRKVIDTGFGEYIFVEETKYKVLTGVARLTKDGQSVSGDTFSMINLPSGELLMALSDGMGSGTSAFDDSKNVIELLEQMSEAGFSQTSAIRLINSLYMSDQEFENYATLDISLINLYKGECSFLKNGAVGTYVLNQGKMYCIEGQSLPMGVVSDAEPYIGKMSLYPGDYVIMMTDGVADMFSQERYNLEKFIKQIEIVNPGDMAQAIVDEAVSRNKGAVSDDMSVIVAGVWEN